LAIAAGNSVTVSANGSSDWVKLSPGTNRILFGCSSWSTSSVTVQYSDDAETAYGALIKEEDLSEVAINRNMVLDMHGVTGYARITVATYGSSPVTFKVLNSIDNRQ
jgi:hypothetical protein